MRNFLLFLLIFLGIGALIGGGLLISSSSGELLGTPLSLLETSPFDSFLIPGIILFIVLGVAPLLIAIALFKKPKSKYAEQFNFFKDMHWSWSFSIYIAFALIIWIQAQQVFINGVYCLHSFYMFWALLILFVALQSKLRSNYKKSSSFLN